MGIALQQRADTVRVLAANVSHEFKTPLTSLRGTVELLRDHLDTMDAEQRRRFLDILLADAARLGQLVERLLDLARADVAQPGDAVADALGAARRMADCERDHQRTLELVLPVEAVSVRMDAELLDAVLGNLVQNARDHGGPNVKLALELEPREARFLVSDDGPGISAGNRGRIFEPFFTTTRASGGTGLGLTIVQMLVRAHHGRVALLESPTGTVFRVELPRVG